MIVGLWLLSSLAVLVLIEQYNQQDFLTGIFTALVGLACYSVTVIAAGHPSRVLQTASAILGVGALISLLFVAEFVLFRPFLGQTITGVVAQLILLWSVPVERTYHCARHRSALVHRYRDRRCRIHSSIRPVPMDNRRHDMNKHIHILGICGTFMGGVAALARAAGFRVTGCDSAVYPPMSTQLRDLGIEIHEGFDAAQLDPAPDCVVIGNVMSRGNDVVEAVLDRGLPYTSGPRWLADNVLRDRHVLAIAGTHGKTTTASMLAWILEDAGLAPGYLIGGIPTNFGVSASFGDSRFFVVEADEYDTAFFDKRAKFVHYSPRTLVLNNLEFDHADIYKDMEAIQWQFHQLLRTVSRERSHHYESC